jgi:hypothetical protein
MALEAVAGGALTFDALPHVYTLDGTPVRSVTTILRKVGLINFDGIPPSILEAAQQRGTKVHQAIHYFNEHDLDVAGFCADFPAYAGYLQSWIRLMDSGRFVTHFCEHRVASRRPRFAGTFDWLGTVDGHAAILDFATGDPRDAAKHLQTAAYVMAAREWAEELGEDRLLAFIAAHPFIERYSVRLTKAGTLPTPHPYRDPHDYTAFRLIAQAIAVVDEAKPKSQPWDWQADLADVA